METQTQIQKFDGNMALTALTPEQAIQRHQMLVAFIKSSLVDGRDYGVIPGTDKRSLWKPGAEKLCTLFGYSVRLVPVEVERDWGGKEHSGEPFFFYEYRCEITHGAVSVVESYGNCNSFEKKYRFREGKRICPKCQRETIYRSKPRPNDQPGTQMGWYCWNKKGGCGSTFAAGDPTITSQKVGMVKNDEIFDLVNTIDKMAQKRALVGATVIACNASEFFSTEFDQEDFEDGALTTRAIIVEDSPEVVKEKSRLASSQLRADQGDDDLVSAATNTRVGEPVPDGTPYQPEGLPAIPQRASIEWPSKLLNNLVMRYKGGTVHEYRARLNKSTMIKAEDSTDVIVHWMDIYNKEHEAGAESDESARRADADLQATRESA